MLDRAVGVFVIRALLGLFLALPAGLLLMLVGPTDARQSLVPPRSHAALVGDGRAVDGDTLLVGGIRVRLDGIDAPEIEQVCNDATGRPWLCGAEAHRVLAWLVAGRQVHCVERGLDAYRRLLGICRVGTRNINAELVRRGLAWAFVRYSRSYVDVETKARKMRVGIWSGTATPPWQYRSDRWHESSDGTAAQKDCPIKGNVTVNGRIYHLPWSPWYGRIRMDGRNGKRWFCSEADAIAAGWRAARFR